MNPDPRTEYGITVETELIGTFTLVPSRHPSPETGGLLDYGIMGTTPSGQRVVFCELFAKAPSPDYPDGIRLDTKVIGERLVALLNQSPLVKTTDQEV